MAQRFFGKILDDSKKLYGALALPWKAGYAPANQMVQSKVNMESVLVAGAVYSTVSCSALHYPQNIVVAMQAAPAAPAK